jgi:hypothetical protein
LLDEAADYLQIHNEQLDVTLQALHIVQDCVEQGWVSFTKPRHVLQLPISKKNRAWRLWVCYVLCLELLPHPETHVDQPTFTQMLQKITGDAVALRRELIEYGLVLREGDGSSYWRPHYSVSRLQEWIAGIPRRVI